MTYMHIVLDNKDSSHMSWDKLPEVNGVKHIEQELSLYQVKEVGASLLLSIAHCVDYIIYKLWSM